MHVNLSDAQLILLWMHGDDQAFEILYKRYAVSLLSIALKKTQSREVAEEIIQETFLCLFLKRSSADQIKNLSAFLYTTVKHKIIDHYRREKLSRQYQEHSLAYLTEADYSTVQTIESRELAERINTQIERLPPKCKHVFLLSRSHYLTNKQIASQLDISENTVEQHMRKALRILRASFSQAEKIVFITYLTSHILLSLA